MEKNKINATMNTILNINYMEIKNPKIKYLIFANGSLQRIKLIDINNNNIVTEKVFDTQEECYYKLSDIKDKFIKFTSVHSKITHSISHSCINNVLKVIYNYANNINQSPDDIVKDIMNNKLLLPITGRVTPCYIFPSENDIVFVTDTDMIINFNLSNNNLKTCNIVSIYRKNKTTRYTLKNENGSIICERTDFKLLNKKDKKDLFYIS